MAAHQRLRIVQSRNQGVNSLWAAEITKSNGDITKEPTTLGSKYRAASKPEPECFFAHGQKWNQIRSV